MRNFFQPALSCGLWLLITAPALAQSSFNPTIPAAGFNVFTKSAVQFSAGDTHGPVATGGDVILAGNTIVSMNYHGYYPYGNGNTANYGLVVGGRIWYNSGNQTQLNRGQIRLGASAGTNVYQINSNGTSSQVQLSAGALNANPNIQTNSSMPLNSVTTGNGLNFATAFTAMQNYSTTIDAYPTTHASSRSINFLTAPPMTGGGTQTITVAAGKVNYLTLTAAQFSAMSSSGITYQFSRTLDSSTVVVYNITATGTYTWDPAATGGISDNSMGDGRYILYNFPFATRINITGGRSTIGSILAPRAAIYKTGGNNAAGTIIADSFSMQYGEVHYAPFGGMLPGTSTALPVESLGITGTVTGEGIRLYWSAAGRTTGADIYLDRSFDGADFRAIAALPQGTGGDYLDVPDAANRRVYYRLRLSMLDEKDRLSAVWSTVRKDNGPQVQLAPNPFTNQLQIISGGEIRWTLLNAHGASVSHGASTGAFVISGLESLPPGAYFFCAESNGSIIKSRLLK